jgi:hypothetical protein
MGAYRGQISAGRGAKREKESRTGRGWLGVGGWGRWDGGTAESESEVESREKRAGSRAVVCGVSSRACFGGKWFTEIFSVNRFPFFPKHFTVK